MTTILTTDLHFALGPSAEHRTGILRWLKQEAKNCKADQVIVLGDLTEQKDEHSAHLVEDITAGIYNLAQQVKVIILLGNHDYLDSTTPFFGFLSKFQNVSFVSRPTAWQLKINNKMCDALFLPHTRDVGTDWKEIDFTRYQYIFVHQTFTGALSENGHALKGTPVSIFGGTKAIIYSGDIHVPQKLGVVEYVGAPYRMRFGDSFNPRVICLRHGNISELAYPCPDKYVVELLENNEFGFPTGQPSKGDYVKVKVHIDAGEFAEWAEIRESVSQQCLDHGWHVVVIEPVVQAKQDGSKHQVQSRFINPKITIREFCKRRALDDKTSKTGRVLIKDFEIREEA